MEIDLFPNKQKNLRQHVISMKYRDQYVLYKLKVAKGCFDKISDLNDK